MLRWLAVACALAAATAHAQDVARMGGIAISAAEVKALLDAQPPEVRKTLAESPEALERSLRTELIRRAVAAEAQGKGWDKRPEVAARVARAREEVIVSTYVNDLARPANDYPSAAEVQAFYDANRERLQLPKRYRVAQIYVKRPADKAAADAAERRVADLAARARAPGADFAALARAGSEHESAAGARSATRSRPPRAGMSSASSTSRSRDPHPSTTCARRSSARCACSARSRSSASTSTTSSRGRRCRSTRRRWKS